MTRFGYVMTTYFAMLVFIRLAFVHPAPRLIWNATASTPTGLYALRPAGKLHALELIAVRAPEPIASYLADGGFLPKGVPAFAVAQDMAEYRKTHHTECDTFDKVYPDEINQGAKVLAEIISQFRDDKVTIFKKRRRHNYRRKKGHRQYLTEIKITEIQA